MAETLRRKKYPRWLTSLIEGLQSTYRTNCLRRRGSLGLTPLAFERRGATSVGRPWQGYDASAVDPGDFLPASLVEGPELGTRY